MPPQIQKTCQVCGKPFMVYPYRALTARVCSHVCGGVLLRTKVSRACLNCTKTFLISPGQFRAYKGAGKYCSMACTYQGRIKENAFKPIKDKYGRSGRTADRNWQKAVREKDQFTCQRCGTVEQYIHTHHVAPRSQRPDLRHETSNGKCLCNSCHSWVHEHPLEAKAAGLLRGETYELARKKLRGEQIGNSKLTAGDVLNIRRRYESGERPILLASEFSVVREHVHAVVTRRVWKHI